MSGRILSYNFSQLTAQLLGQWNWPQTFTLKHTHKHADKGSIIVFLPHIIVFLPYTYYWNKQRILFTDKIQL